MDREEKACRAGVVEATMDCLKKSGLAAEAYEEVPCATGETYPPWGKAFTWRDWKVSKALKLRLESGVDYQEAGAEYAERKHCAACEIFGTQWRWLQETQLGSELAGDPALKLIDFPHFFLRKTLAIQ